MSLGLFRNNVTNYQFIYKPYIYIHIWLLHNTFKIPLANVVHWLTERSEAKSNVKLDGFRSGLRVSYVFSNTEEFW